MEETLPPDDGADNTWTEEAVKEHDTPFCQTGMEEGWQMTRSGVCRYFLETYIA